MNTTQIEAVSFFLNGNPVTIHDPSPDLLLIDYLRSPDVALAGPKKPCGQGGCGGCTVILSRWNEQQKAPEHRAVNSCLRPVCALGGLVVTTVEGTGRVRRPDPQFLTHNAVSSRGGVIDADIPAFARAASDAVKKGNEVRDEVVAAVDKNCGPCMKLVTNVEEHPSELQHDGMNPVAHRLAMNNGSQCGYCSVGFVMNMSEFLTTHPQATKKEIEAAMDGNLCRCTGYRSILTGMKTFASDWTEQDEKERMKCRADDGSSTQLPGTVEIPFPPGARTGMQPVNSMRGAQSWCTPVSLNEMARLLTLHQGKKIRLVHGNTSFGIYKAEFSSTEVFMDIRLIPELEANKSSKGWIVLGAGNTYADLVELTQREMRRRGEAESTALGAIDYMARRTAGRIVRNAASLGGNTMLVLKHITGPEEPFPSDLFTALCAIDAEIEYLEFGDKGTPRAKKVFAAALVSAVVKDASLADRILLLRYRLPVAESKHEVVVAQKAALREVNSHSIVNSTCRFIFSGKTAIKEVVLVFGGIAPFPWRPEKTERLLRGQELTVELAAQAATVLAQEAAAELKCWSARMAALPAEGFTAEYRTQLAVAFFFKAVVNALLQRGGVVPDVVASSGQITWGNWEVSSGKQVFNVEQWKQPVGQPYIKTTAMLQASGQLHYTHELPAAHRAVNAAFVQSRRALATFTLRIPGSKKRDVSARELRDHLSSYAETFIDLITQENIQSPRINLQGMGMDQPLLANGEVRYCGQAVALVLATSETEAQRIAEYVSDHCVAYGPMDTKEWPGRWQKPILELEDAIRVGSVFPDCPKSASFVSHIWKITRPGTKLEWVNLKRAPLDRATAIREGVVVDGHSCVVIEGSQKNGGQAHFYMEPQACVAIPTDEGRMTLHPSSQSPMAMHQTAAMALGWQYNHINVEIPPVGGGFGGKTEQAKFIAGPAAIAANAIKRPVRLVVPRDADTSMIGKRHAYYGQFQIAVDDGSADPAERGRIIGFQTSMWGDGGAFYDCSFVVSNCIQLRTDNAYRIPNFESQIDVCRTNTSPSTAFRSFGDIQCKNIIETALDDAAHAIGMLPEQLREMNLYARGDVTPFGQALSYCYIREVWSYLKEQAGYAEKRRQVDEYNQKNKWRKRGLGMMPVKYGSGYNLVMLEQAAAIVVVNQADGSIVVHHGGVEIGQGLATQVLQVASYVLGVPMSLIHINGVRTDTIPNATSTGASAGTPYSCEAVKQTCEVMRQRLMDFGQQMLKEHGNDWCHTAGIDYWNYGEQGWGATIEGSNPPKLVWQKLISLAYQQRVSLQATFSAKIRGGEVPVPVMTFKPHDQQPIIPGITTAPGDVGGSVDSFCGFTYSAALSVVEVDILTGEVKIISSDLVYDMGRSLNPAIDIGQVEGAFMQGVGYLLTEKLVQQPDGVEMGRLTTTNTWRYKIPAVTEVPLDFNVHLFPRDSANVPDEPNNIFSAKEVGEPPLVLANTVFLAVKAAVRASRIERGLSGQFNLDAPATVQEVRASCEVCPEQLAL